MKLSFVILILLVKQLCKVVPKILHGPYKTKKNQNAKLLDVEKLNVKKTHQQ